MFDSLKEARDIWETGRVTSFNQTNKHGAVSVVWVTRGTSRVYLVLRYFRMNRKWYVSGDFEGALTDSQFFVWFAKALELTRDI